MRILKKTVQTIIEVGRDKNLLMMGLLVLMLIISLISNTNKYPDAYWGVPVVSENYPDLHARNIEQVLSDEEYLYILPHHSNGIIQVCNLDGEYAYTLFFYENLNGHFSMTMEHGVLYVRDMRGNVYTFRHGVFDRFVKESDVQQQFSHIDLLSNKSSTGYEIRSNSIWKSTTSGEICIVETQKSYSLSTPLIVAVVCLLVIFKMVQESRKTANG